MSIIKLARAIHFHTQATRAQTKTHWMDLWFRFFSKYISAIYVQLGFGPNQITWSAILLAVLGGGLISQGTSPYELWGGLCLLGFYLLDYCDGEVARYLKSHTMGGHYLDYFGHFFAFISLQIGMTIHLYQLHGDFWVMVLGMLGLAGLLMRGLSQALSWEVVCYEHMRAQKTLTNANHTSTYRPPLGDVYPGQQPVLCEQQPQPMPRHHFLSSFIRGFKNICLPVGGDLYILSSICVLWLDALLSLHITPIVPTFAGFRLLQYFFMYASVGNIVMAILLIVKRTHSQDLPHYYRHLFHNETGIISL